MIKRNAFVLLAHVGISLTITFWCLPAWADPAGDALDQPSLLFNESITGMASWDYLANGSHDGMDAALLDMPSFGDQGSISTFISFSTPATISFWYRDTQYEIYPDPAPVTFTAGAFSGQYQSTTWTNIRVSMPAGNYQLTWSGEAGFSGGAFLLDQLEIIPPMGDAVDQPNYSFATTASKGSWDIAGTTYTHDGVDAAALTMPSIASGGREGRLSTTITGPVDVSFWYISTSGSPRLSFQTQSLTNDYQSFGWTNITVSLTSGIQSLVWRGYSTNISPGPSQRILLDQFVFAFPPGQPALGVAPTILTNTFQVGASPVTSSFRVAISSVSNMPYTVTSSVPWLSSSPSSGNSAGQTNVHGAIINPSLLGYGVHTGRLTVTAVGTLGSPTTITVVARAIIPLPEALDNTSLSINLNGADAWFGQTNETHDGQDAAQSGPATNNGIRRMQTSVIGPGTLSFWWKTSTETNNDRAILRIDAATNAVLSGNSTWTLVNATVPEGFHTLSWDYQKNASLSSGADTVWVDELIYTRQGPTLRVLPSGISNVCGLASMATPQSYEIRNIGTGVLEFALSSDVAWIVPQPASGAITGGASSFQSAFVTNLYQTDTLATGVHTGRVTISAPGSLDAPTQLVVVLHVLTSTGVTLHVNQTGLNLYPFATWTDAATNIQDALDRAPPGATVLVDDGTYYEYVSVSKAVVLRSAHGPANCAIRGSADFAYDQIVTLSSTSTLEGFSIIGRTNSVPPPGIRGVYAYPGTTIRRCIIRGNTVLGLYGSPGSGCFTNGPSSCVESVGLPPGDALGGGVYCADCTIESSLIYSNSVWSTLPSLGCTSNCMTYYYYGAARGGGVYASGTANIYNCTIVDNRADAYSGGTLQGGGLYAASTGTLIVNSIIISNHSPTMANVGWPAGAPSFLYSFYSPVTQANQGNADANPKFENALNHNFRLSAGSPCINAGTNEAWMLGSVDLDGNARLSGGVADVGAYERILPGPAGDVDDDGLPDDWELRNGLYAYASNPPSSDMDGDGATDADEYIADTHPTNALSIFPRMVITNAPTGTLQFPIHPTSTARVYAVHRTDNLMAQPQIWVLIAPEATGTGGAIFFTVTNEAAASAYRTRVRLP